MQKESDCERDYDKRNNLTKSRPIGITIIAIFVWLYALVTIIMGIYLVMVPLSDVGNIQISLILQIAYVVVLGIIGIFLWKGKHWAKIVLGVMAGFGILGNISGLASLKIASIISLIVYFCIFIYLVFFKSAEEFFLNN